MLLIVALFVFCTNSGCLCLPTHHFPGQADQVTQLPGAKFAIPFGHYSGYLPLHDGTNLHYWFFESQSQHRLKDPLVLWLNGGPGCSSLFGAMLECGPFQLNQHGNLILNPYSWNSNANLLFLESPVGVGFSYRDNVPLNHK